MKRYFFLILLYFIVCDSYSQTEWCNFEINSAFKISIPSTIELRHKEDTYTNLKSYKYEQSKYNDSIIIFQQKNLSNMSKEGFNKYCRIIITYSKGNHNDYLNANESPALTQEDYKTFNEEIQFQVRNAKLLNIQSIKWRKIGDICALVSSYRRVGAYKTPIQVKIFYLANNNEVAEILMSYKESEADIWAADFEKIINSFRWNNLQLAVDDTTSLCQNVGAINDSDISASTIFYIIVFFIIAFICYLLILFSKYKGSLSPQKEEPIKKQNTFDLSHKDKAIISQNTIGTVDSKQIELNLINLIRAKFKNEPLPISIIMAPQDQDVKSENIYKPIIIVNSGERTYVGYSVPKEFIQNNISRYTVTKYPQNGCIVWPHRKGKIARRGKMEEGFQKLLEAYLNINYSFLRVA